MICEKCGNLLNESGICPNCNNNVSPDVGETPVVESVPVIEPQPVVEPSTEASAPITSEAPVVSETPVVESVPVIEPQPVVEPSTENVTANNESTSVAQVQSTEASAPITSEAPVVSETPVVESVPVIEPQPVVEQSVENITSNNESTSVAQTQSTEASTSITTETSAVNVQQNIEQPSKSSNKKLIIILASIIGVLLIIFIVLLILKPWVKDEEYVDKEAGSIKDAYENVNGMFNEAKKNAFVTEVQKYMDTSKTSFMQEALMKPAQSVIFSNIDDAVDYYGALRLDVDENDKKYYIEMNRHGNFVRVLVYDGVACYDTDSIFDDMSVEQFDKSDVNISGIYEGNKNDSLDGCYNAN